MMGDLKTTFATIFANFSNYYGSIALLLNDIALVMAVVFAYITLVKLRAHYQYPENNSIAHIFALASVAGILANIGLMTTIGGQSIFGENYEFMSYGEISEATQLDAQSTAILKGVVGFIQLVGFIAFFYGVMLMRHAGRPGGGPQGSSLSQGAIFMIGGLAAINILLTVYVIAFSIGMTGAYESVVGEIFN